MFFLVFLVPLSILTISRRGKGSGGPGPDIRNRRSILYRIEAEKKKSIFHSNLAFRAPYKHTRKHQLLLRKEISIPIQIGNLSYWMLIKENHLQTFSA